MYSEAAQSHRKAERLCFTPGHIDYQYLNSLFFFLPDFHTFGPSLSFAFQSYVFLAVSYDLSFIVLRSLTFVIELSDQYDVKDGEISQKSYFCSDLMTCRATTTRLSCSHVPCKVHWPVGRTHVSVYMKLLVLCMTSVRHCWVGGKFRELKWEFIDEVKE